MKTSRCLLTVLIACIVLSVGCHNGNVKPITRVEENIQERGKQRSVSIFAESYLDKDQPIKIRFSMPMVRPLEVGTHTLDPQRLSVSFSPSIRGNYKWESEDALVFYPGKNELGWGKDIQLAIDKAVPVTGASVALRETWKRTLQVKHLVVAGKVASWPVIPGYPRFIQALTSYTNEIGQGPLLLLYDQQVSPEKIRPYVNVSSMTGKKLSVTVSRPSDLGYIFDDNNIPPEIIAVYIKDLPANGEYIAFDVPEWYLDDTGTGTNVRMEIVKQNLRVNKTFAVTDVEKPGKRPAIFPLESRIGIKLNNNFNYSDIQRQVTITPKPLSFYIYRDWDGAIIASARFAPGTDYTLAVSSSLRDVLGNKLEPFTLKFRSEDLPPVLEAPNYPLVLEQNRSLLQVKVRNMTKLEARVYTISDPREFAKALSATNRRSAIDYGLSGGYKTYKIDSSSAQMNSFATLDAVIDSNLGLKCVEIRGVSMGSEGGTVVSDTVLVQSTNTGITTKVMNQKLLVVTSSLDKADLVANAGITLYSGTGAIIATGTSDKLGATIFRDVKQAKATGVAEPIVVVVKRGNDCAVSRLVNDELSSPWQFGIAGAVEDSGVLRASVFTERGAYRPGEKVHAKVIVSREEAKPGDTLKLAVKDPRGKEAGSATLTLDEYRASSYELELKKEAAVGEYSVSLEMGKNRCGTTFRVEEYRVPTFIVTVSSEDTEWLPGANASFFINAEYLHGAKLGGREVKWNVFRQNEAFSSPGFPGYQFTLDTHPEQNGFTAKDETKLGGDGRLAVDFSLSGPEVSGPVRYTVGATVTDIDRQAFAGRFSRLVHSSDFYIGVLPPAKIIVRQGEMVSAPVVAVATDNTIRAGVKVTAMLERIDYHTTGRVSESGVVELFNRIVPEKIDEQTLTTKAAPVQCSFRAKNAGYYRVRLVATDRSGRNTETGFVYTVSGDNTTAWPRFDKDQIGLVFDKTEYRPGETAKIVVQTPYDTATGFLTVERDDVLLYERFDIKKNTPEIPLRIEGRFAPNVYVSVVLLRGRVHNGKDATGFETGAPGFKIGYKKIRVDLAEQKLNVKAVPVQKFASPGDTVSVDLALTDYKGNPAPGQVTLMVVDEAVLSLTNYKTPNPLYQVYADYPLGSRTGTLYLDLPNSRHERREQLFPGGGFGEDDLTFGMPISVRNLFQSTVYWNPNVRIRESGKLRVQVKLPDNITTYRIMAVASDLESRIGTCEDKLTSRKPLMIQPALPRFLYPGDEFEAEALVFNSSSVAGNIDLVAKTEGLSLVSGSLTQKKQSKPGDATSFTFRAKATDRGQCKVRFTAKMNDETDAAEFTIPVLEPGTKRVVVDSKSVIRTGTISVDIPSERVAGTLNVELVASSTALSELKDSVQYLMQYPNGCIEQTTSTAYPLVVLGDLLPEIGLDVDMAKLKEFAEAGVKRILSFQTDQGGLSYWPGGTEPHAFATSFGLTALIEAKRKGYDVPDDSLARMAKFLEDTLKKDEIKEEMPHRGMADGDTRALIVMTLGRLGKPQASYVSTLWRERSKLSAFGLSFLAISVMEMGGDKALLNDILSEIRKDAEETNEEAYFSGKPKGGWSFDSPLRTHGTSLIAYAEGGKDDEVTSKLLKGLLARRQSGLWGNTQENVFGIMGVYEVVTGKKVGDAPSIVLDVNGKRYTTANLEHISKSVYRLSLSESEIKGNRLECTLTNNMSSQVYFTMRMSYDVPLEKKYMEAESRGFRITRSYSTTDGKSLDGQMIPNGTLVRVKLHVQTEKNLHYVAIDDKLPAGLEPLNRNLASTESVEMGPLTTEIQRGLSVLSYHEIRDHRVAFYADEMLANTYEFVYHARATTAGIYLRPSARAEAMYEPNIFGTTSMDFVTVQ